MKIMPRGMRKLKGRSLWSLRELRNKTILTPNQLWVSVIVVINPVIGPMNVLVGGLLRL